jgi:hypothetical protein
MLIAAGPFHLLADEITHIKGYAPKYIGKQVEIFQILDYISMKQERIATATVQEDSTFTCSFYLKETQKLVIASNNNSGFIYASPGASYEIYMPDRNKHDPYRPLGNKVELTFLGMDSTDINYKILTFNRWVDEMLATYYTKNNSESQYFAKRLDQFKTDVQNYYKNDSTDAFFRSHVRYTLARIDNMRFLGSRNQYEKYDFYLRNTPVYYQSDAYMEYVVKYYDKMLTHIDSKINEKIYQALLKSSPTLILRAMGTEYTLQNNIRLREVVMIKTLGEAFFEKDYPQTNILSVLDSVAQFALYPENRIIARNISLRLTELSPGAKAPDFNIAAASGNYDLRRFSGKHLYLIFVSPAGKDVRNQLDLLVPIYRRYVNEVQFLMVVKRTANSDEQSVAALQKSVPWESVVVDENSDVLKNYQVVNTPHYVVIDPIGYVVAAPALGPMPNGEYETIDKLFFDIRKAIEDGTGDGR